MYTIKYANRFRQSFKRCIKRGLNISLYEEAITILSKEGRLPAKYRPHKLSGQYSGCWECHIQPDWLLVWEQNDTELTLLLIDNGTHADLF